MTESTRTGKWLAHTRCHARPLGRRASCIAVRVCRSRTPLTTRLCIGPLMASIYRSFTDMRPSSDQDVRYAADRTRRLSGIASINPPTPQTPPKDQSFLRKLAPAEYMLPGTIVWFAALPVDVRPEMLASQFARITNLLAIQWGTPASCGAYFSELLTDRRRGRAGFPPPVQLELLKLRDYYFSRRLALQP